ncbi:MAG: prepilin-type N-terminal cleavage/methylation domain-containing protein [Longimicrobiales bacterium]
MRLRREGFTLIELLIVVVIIGILAAIAIPKFSSTREKAFVASMKSDLRNLATLQDIYHNANYTYTNSAGDLGFVNSDGVVVTVSSANGQGWAATSAHAGYPGAECELMQGTATPVGPASVEGQIACIP